MPEAYVEETQKKLGAIISTPKLSEKLLVKPPFRFLHDITTSFIKATGFPQGLFPEDMLDSANVGEKEKKVQFLSVLMAVVEAATGTKPSANPSKIVSGQEPEQTNELLQLLASCAALSDDKKAEAVKVAKKVADNLIASGSTGGGDEEKHKKREEKKHRDEDGEKKKHRDEDGEKKKHRDEDGEKKKHRDEDGEKKKHRDEDGEKKKHRDEDGEKKKHRDEDGEKKKHRDEDGEKKKHREEDGEKKKHREEDGEKKKHRDEDGEKKKHRDEDGEKKKHREEDGEKKKHREEDGEKKKHREEDGEKKKHRDEDGEKKKHREEDGEKKKHRDEDGEKKKHREEDGEKKKHRDEDGEKKKHREEDGEKKKHREEDGEKKKHREEDGEKKKHRDEDGEKKKHRDEDGEKKKHRDEDGEKKKHREKADERTQGASGGETAELKGADGAVGGSSGQSVPTRQLIRKSSADKGPARLKTAQDVDDNTLNVAEVIRENKRGSGKDAKDGDGEDDWMRVAEQQNVRPTKDDGEALQDGEAKGYLGQQALKAKREQEEEAARMENEAGARGPRDAGIIIHSNKAGRSGGAMAEGELSKLRQQLQLLTKASNPLGKLLESIYDDIDTMGRELEMWRSEARSQALAAADAKRQTTESLQEVYAQLQALDEAINDQILKNHNIRRNIITNDNAIAGMVRMFVNPDALAR